MTALTDLPNPGAYVKLWRRAYAEADAGRKVRLSWAGRDLDAVTVRREFRRALDKRINARGGLEECGRNYDTDQYWRLVRDQQRIQRKLTQRVAVHQFETKIARKRFGHLLSRYDD